MHLLPCTPWWEKGTWAGSALAAQIEVEMPHKLGRIGARRMSACKERLRWWQGPYAEHACLQHSR